LFLRQGENDLGFQAVTRPAWHPALLPYVAQLAPETVIYCLIWVTIVASRHSQIVSGKSATPATPGEFTK